MSEKTRWELHQDRVEQSARASDSMLRALGLDPMRPQCPCGAPVNYGVFCRACHLKQFETWERAAHPIVFRLRRMLAALGLGILLLALPAVAHASLMNDCANYVQPKLGPYKGDTMIAEIAGRAYQPSGVTMDAFSLADLLNGARHPLVHFSSSELDDGCVLAAGIWVCNPLLYKSATYTAQVDGERVHAIFYWNGTVSNSILDTCIVQLDWMPPTLSPCTDFGICTRNTITFCWNLAGTQVADPASCYISGLGIVNPMSCSCVTRVLAAPKTQAEVSRHQKLAALYQATANAAAVGVSWTSVTSLGRVFKVVASAAALMAARETAIANDPPDPNFQSILAPYVLPWTPVAGASDLTTAQATALDAWQANVSALAGAYDAASVSLDRWTGAVAASAPDWEEQQRDAFNTAILAVQTYMAREIVIRQGFTGPTWNASKKPRVPDLHQYLAPYTNATDLQNLSAGVSENLEMVP